MSIYFLAILLFSIDEIFILITIAINENYKLRTIVTMKFVLDIEQNV